MPLRAMLRADQRLEEVGGAADAGVCVYAAPWVRALAERVLPATPVEVLVTDGENQLSLTVTDPLIALCVAARNEARNVTGRIRRELYRGTVFEDDPGRLYSLKDLVKLVVTVGMTRGKAFGGFGGAAPVTPCFQRFYLVDLVGLQFQQPYNTGRLVLNGPAVPRGAFDEEIFERVVGEPRPSFSAVRADATGRFRRGEEKTEAGGETFFDTRAYRSFVAFDFCQACVALNEAAASEGSNDAIHFRFLRYGAGFFGGAYAKEIAANIGLGVAKGVERYGETTSFRERNRIRCLELPFYPESEEVLRACAKLGIRCVFSRVDALQPLQPLKTTETDQICVLATTNCADPHVVVGNEMRHGSVDAAIAENLVDRGAAFSPLLNRRLRAAVLRVR